MKMKSASWFIVLGIVLQLTELGPGPLRGADATFSLDGTHVFMIDPNYDAVGLVDVNLSSGKIDKLTTPGKDRVEAVTLSQSGFVLWATVASVHAYDPTKRTMAKVCDAPRGTEITDIAYNPATGATLICTRPKTDGKKTVSDDWEIFLLSKGAHKPVSVFNRRVRYIEGPVFAQDGTLYFGTEGDAWSGAVRESEAADERPALFAYRFAPLATRETSDGTPAQEGIRDLAVTREYIYAHLRRMGGSGWGEVIRFRRPQTAPPQKKADEDPIKMPTDLKEYVVIYSAELASLEMLGANGTNSHLCASADGKHVFFRTKGDEENARAIYWLIGEDGKPQQIELKLE